jgi:hypothetical protein
MNELTVITPKSLVEAKEMSTLLSRSELLAEAFRGKEASVLLTIMTGSELGMTPMQALGAFDVIKGRMGMKPVAMIALVRSHPSIEEIDCVESTATSATWESKRRGSTRVLRTTFTMDNAKVAGLVSSDMYRKWPEQMLMWRAAAVHCRKHHSDITMGFYTTEEVETFDGPAPTSPIPALAREVVESTARPVPAPTPTPTPAVSRVQEVAEKVAKALEGQVTKPAAKPSPPRPPLPEDQVVQRGKHKGKPVSGLEADELADAIVEHEAGLAKTKEPKARAQVEAWLGALKDEQQHRIDAAGEFS